MRTLTIQQDQVFEAEGIATMKAPRNRATYTYTVHGQVIAIEGHDEGRSVTNDADAVIADLARDGFDLSAYRVIYRDTEGVWDELVTMAGRFTGFRSINETNLAAALAKVTV